MAGLLTFSFPGAFPSSDPETINSNRNKTVAWYARKKTEITAAGTVQDLHLVPYYPEL